MEDKKYELVWVEFNRNDRQVNKRNEFKSEAAMQKFIEKLVEKENFCSIYGSREV